PPKSTLFPSTTLFRSVRCCCSHSISYPPPSRGSLPGCGALLGSVANRVAAVGLFLGVKAQLADEVRRQRSQRGTLQQQGHRRFHTEVATNGVADSHSHQRIHAQFGQR